MFLKVLKTPVDKRPFLTTALPASPNDRDQIILTDSLTAGTYQWLLQYVAARSTNKWVFVGGTSLYSEVTTQESTTSTSYVALTTAGPSVALPAAGDYMVELGAGMTVTGAGASCYMSYDIGGTAAVDADATQTAWAAVSSNVEGVRLRKKTGLAAVTLTAKYRVSAQTGFFNLRFMQVIPIAIGG